MKIETRDMVPEPEPEPEYSAPVRTNKGLYARAGIAMVAAAVMIGALRWAVMTTNDNERHVSSTLTALQGQIEAPSTDSSPFPEAQLGKMKTHRTKIKSDAGPTIEPTEDR